MELRLFAIVVGLYFTCQAMATELPLVEDVQTSSLRIQCEELLTIQQKLGAAGLDAAFAELSRYLNAKPLDPVVLQRLLDEQCLIGISINPESRVKAIRGPAPAVLKRGKATLVLIKVQNDAGVTNDLRVSGPRQVGTSTVPGDGWLDVSIIAPTVHGGRLTGCRLEYRFMQLRSDEVGKREATLKFDVGQGSQDLGFRAEVPVLFTIKP